MKYNRLGNSGLYVSEICYGVMTFTGTSGWTHLGKTTQQEANRLITIALDKGVNFFDTADFYSKGLSETMLGKAFGKNRKDAVVCTKFGFEMKDDPNGKGLSRKRVIEACEESLKRLNTDYIDLYLIHALDFVTPLEETLSALTQLVRDGKVRYIGCSNFPAWMLTKAFYISEKNGFEKIIAHQANYSLLRRDLEFDIIPASLEFGIGTTVWGPLHGGILTGKYHGKKDHPKNTRMKKPEDHNPYNLEKGSNILDEMELISNKRNVSMSQVAIKYLLQKRGISSVIIGARNEKQLMDNINSVEWLLSEAEMEKLNKISEPEAFYPHWYYNIFWKENYKKYYMKNNG